MLKRTGSKGIRVDRHPYRYTVSEVAAGAGAVLLSVTVQHAVANGSRLRVTGLRASRVPEAESKFYTGRTLAAGITPRDVERLIRMALSQGWRPLAPGKPVELRHGDGEGRPLPG
jgi:hypothetical protein